MYNIHFAFIKLNSHESDRLTYSGSVTEEVLQTVDFRLLGVCLKWNKHTKLQNVRMSVDTGGGKL